MSAGLRIDPSALSSKHSCNQGLYAEIEFIHPSVVAPIAESRDLDLVLDRWNTFSKRSP